MSAQTLVATPDPQPRPERHPRPGDLYVNLGGELIQVIETPPGKPVRCETMHGSMPRNVPAWQFANYELRASCPPALGFRPEQAKAWAARVRAVEL